MKKIYLFTTATALAFLFFYSETNAQTLYPLPSPGLIQTEIYHQDWTQNFAPVNRSFAHTTDTVVNGYTYAEYRYIPFTWQQNPFYTWYDAGKVYFQANSTPATPSLSWLMYDFTLALGDSFYLNNSFWLYGWYTVDSVSLVTLPNAQQRKYMRLSNPTDTVEWIDGIGDIKNGFFYYTDFEGGYYEIVCIEDSLGPLYAPPTSSFICDPNDPIPGSGPNSCAPFNYNANVFGASCVGCNGAVTISNITGGAGMYTFHWSNGATSQNVSNLCQGPITLTITDAMGDSCSRTFVIGLNTINMNFSSPDVNHCDEVDTFCISPLGGTPPYFYQWSTGTNGYCEVVYTPGIYNVTATDANGCTGSHVFTVGGGAITNTTQPIGASCVGCCDGDATLSFIGGTPPYTVTYPNGPWPTANNFCMGWYSYCVVDAFGCGMCDSVFVLEPLGVNAVTDSGFEMYPNPAEDYIEITSAGSETRMSIYNLAGKVILEKELTTIQSLVDISGLADGIYFVVIGIHTEKLVIFRE